TSSRRSFVLRGSLRAACRLSNVGSPKACISAPTRPWSDVPLSTFGEEWPSFGEKPSRVLVSAARLGTRNEGNDMDRMRHHPLLVTLHWLLAALVIAMLAIGFLWLRPIPN